jgi:hypothetical protein
LFLERVRKQVYNARRRSEPKLRIPDLSNDNYIEVSNEGKEKTDEESKKENELIPKQSYNSNRKRFRDYYGKRRKKRIEPQDKIMDFHFKKERIFNIGTKNKGWRHKEAQESEKFKGKYVEEIEDIYQGNLNKKINETSSLLQTKLRNRNRKKAEVRKKKNEFKRLGTKSKGVENFTRK